LQPWRLWLCFWAYKLEKQQSVVNCDSANHSIVFYVSEVFNLWTQNMFVVSAPHIYIYWWQSFNGIQNHFPTFQIIIAIHFLWHFVVSYLLVSMLICFFIVCILLHKYAGSHSWIDGIYNKLQIYRMANNNTNSDIYAVILTNLGYITCFDPNGSSSGVSSYILFTHWIAMWDSHIPINIHMS
jgi:hypothetical protein